MAPKPVLALAILAAAAAVSVGGCTPTVAYSGFQAREDKPADVKVGVDTKSTVLARLGSPSITAAFDPNIWYYVSQTSNKIAYKDPKVTSRDVVAIQFSADEKVATVKAYRLGSGYQVAYNKNSTPTRGRELSVIEQLLGNVGRGSELPPENDPGQRRPGN